jgi:hypothetical protein
MMPASASNVSHLVTSKKRKTICPAVCDAEVFAPVFVAHSAKNAPWTESRCTAISNFFDKTHPVVSQVLHRPDGAGARVGGCGQSFPSSGCVQRFGAHRRSIMSLPLLATRSAYGLRRGCVRAFATATSTASIPHSDLSYRALLRNMKLLSGMRGDKTRFNVFVTGLSAPEVASHLAKLEPSLDIETGGTSRAADFGECSCLVCFAAWHVRAMYFSAGGRASFVVLAVT